MVTWTAWTGSQAAGYGFTTTPPAASPLQVPVSTTAGDWLIAIVAWRQPQPGQGVSVSVADDAHNWWEPVGAPAADSPAAGTVRTAVWAAPAARAARYVQVAPTGPCIALAAVILDVTGLQPWYQVAGVTGSYAQGAASLGPLPLAVPPSQALVIAALANDKVAGTLADTGTGWATVTTVTAANGSDTLSDIQLLAQLQVATAATSATLTSSVAADLAGTLAGVLISAPAPAQPSPAWPVVITEVAIGSGPQSPPAGMSWTALSPRALEMSVQQGRQYTLSQLQAGQGTLRLDNPDGALIPGQPPQWQLQFSGNGTTANPGAQSQQAGGITPGAAYQASVLMASVQGWASAQLDVNWFTSAGAYISTGSGPLVALPAGGAAVTVATGPLTAPASAALCTIIPQLAGTPASGVIATVAAGLQPAGYLQAVTPWQPNNSAAVTVLAPWAPSWPGTDSGTPVRQRVILPATTTPHYVAFNGYLKRWPFTIPGDMLRGETTAEITDAWAYMAGTLESMARQEMLLDNPYALWPLSDPAGSAAGSNIAPGNSNPLTQVTSKYGAAGATVTWGATPPAGALAGDNGPRVTGSGKGSSASGMFQQSLPASALTGVAGYGYALGCPDTGYPPISGGVTIECWAQCTANLNTTGNGFSNSGNTITVTGSSFPSGTPVIFSVAPGFTLPAGMTAGLIYWVINQSGATFQISTTPGGGVVTLSTNGAGFCATTTPWSPVIWSIRNARGQVASLAVNNLNGNLMLNYQPASGAAVGVVADATRDYRLNPMWHFSVSLSRAAWRVLVGGGGILTASGNFSGQIAPYFDELWMGGIFDRTATGYAFPGYLALAAVYPGTIPQPRVIAHWASASYGLAGDPAHARVERAVEYAGMAGRRLVLQQSALPYYQQDITASGKDVGGSSAAQMASNIQQSTIPALLYVAPTGDITYLSKQYAWNQPVKWVLGDNAAAGEIPFILAQLATDYDPARVVDDVQLAHLDTQSVTVPAGVMSATTVAAIEAAAQVQYGDQLWSATGYLNYDYGAPYGNGPATLQDLANWAAMVYRKPANRVQAVTVSAAASSAGASPPSRWQLWAGASVGDMVTVNVRLPTAATSPLISLTARITQTQRAMKWATDGVAATIGLVLDFAPEYQALTCDDPVRGLLNGSNVLPW